jgi:hypothetical protein
MIAEFSCIVSTHAEFHKQGFSNMDITRLSIINVVPIHHKLCFPSFWLSILDLLQN